MELRQSRSFDSMQRLTIAGTVRRDAVASGRASSALQNPARPLPAEAVSNFDEYRFINAHGSRAYKLYIPTSLNGAAAPSKSAGGTDAKGSDAKGKTFPLIVMLHGCTQSPDDFAVGTRMNELADQHGFFVAYPAQPASANASRCWNWFNAADQRRDSGEAGLIAGITRQIMAAHAIDPDRVYVAGLSAGGAAAAILGAAYPDIFAAIGVHSGLASGAARGLPGALQAMRQGGTVKAGAAQKPLPAIVFHGDRDSTVNPVNGVHVLAQARAGATFESDVVSGVSHAGQRYSQTVETDDTGKVVLESWVLHGAGHAWAGGSLKGTYTDPAGPDASREMVRFFLTHTKSAS
jgi:poly(hydroxyalkanoate) depolymerase family esterase